MNKGLSSARPTEQALVNEAPAGLHPSGFDPSRGSENPDFYEYLRRFTAMGKAVHDAAEKLRESKPEGRLSRAVEAALSDIEAQAADVRWSVHWRCGLGQAIQIMRSHLDAASAIEARRAETQSGSVHESAVPQADAQDLSPAIPGEE